MFHWMLSSVICSTFIYIQNILPYNFLWPKMARKHERHAKSIKYTYGCHLAWSKGRASWELENPSNLFWVFISCLDSKTCSENIVHFCCHRCKDKNWRTAWIAGRMHLQYFVDLQRTCTRVLRPTIAMGYGHSQVGSLVSNAKGRGPSINYTNYNPFPTKGSCYNNMQQ